MNHQNIQDSLLGGVVLVGVLVALAVPEPAPSSHPATPRGPAHVAPDGRPDYCRDIPINGEQDPRCASLKP